MRFSRDNTDRIPAVDSVSARGWLKSFWQAISNGIGSIRPGFTVAGPLRVPFFRSGYDVLRIFTAVMLLTAAVLKTHQLATEPVIGTGLLNSRWLLMASVEFELFFGLWLLANITPRATWAAALGLFGLFTCVSLYKALSGAASCGCFGRVEVNPWYTASLDLAIVLSLLYWRHRQLPSPAGKGAGGEGMQNLPLPAGGRGAGSEGMQNLPSPTCGRGAGGEGDSLLSFFSLQGLVQFFRSETGSLPVLRVQGVLAVWLLLGLPAAFAIGNYADTTLSDAGKFIGDGKIVVLEPEKWVDKRFPLLQFIDDTPGQLRATERPLRERLIEGEWIVMLYHRDCPECQVAISKYEKLARCSAADSTVPRVALIEVPIYGCSSTAVTSYETPCAVGRLRNENDWFVETPLEFSLREGTVKSYQTRRRNSKGAEVAMPL